MVQLLSDQENCGAFGAADYGPKSCGAFETAVDEQESCGAFRTAPDGQEKCGATDTLVHEKKVLVLLTQLFMDTIV